MGAEIRLAVLVSRPGRLIGRGNTPGSAGFAPRQAQWARKYAWQCWFRAQGPLAAKRSGLGWDGGEGLV